MFQSVKKKCGFTLLEIVLTVSIIGALMALAIPVYQSFQVKNDLDIAAQTMAQSLRRAQVLAQAVEGDASWGVQASLGSIVLFKGANFATRAINFDETFEVPGSITPSGLLEVVFAKFSGLPQNTGTTTLTTVTNETKTITINAKGTVLY